MAKRKVFATVAIAGMACSALALLVGITSGIAYGDLLGIQGREHDLDILRTRAATAMTVATLSGLLTVLAIVATLTGTSLVRPIERYGAAILVGAIGTAVLFGLILWLVSARHWF
jgi:hypothetical protein